MVSTLFFSVKINLLRLIIEVQREYVTYISKYFVEFCILKIPMDYTNNTIEFVLFNTTKPCFEVKFMEITRLEIREIALY